MVTEWWPSLKEYDPHISKEKWLEILDNREITYESNLHILACLYDFGGEATCTQLAQQYGETKNTYNSGFSNYAKRLVKTEICLEPPFRDDESSRWWPVLFVGHYAEKNTPGSYVWKLREELKEACEQYNILQYIAKKDNFTWIPFYKEMANKLLEYKDNRDELLKILYSVLDKLGLSSTMYVNNSSDGSTEPLTNIDPLTFMGAFNRGNKIIDRINIANGIAEFLNMKERLSNNEKFISIPILNSQHSTLTFRNCPEEDYDKLWKLFEEAIKFNIDNPKSFIKAFDNAITVKGTGQKYATMSCYWINPYNIFSLDGNNIDYLSHYGIDVRNTVDGEYYIELLKKVIENLNSDVFLENSIPEFSSAAWSFNKNTGKIGKGEKNMITSDDISKLLLNTHNLILHGAPGTGKTHLAKQIAKEMGCSDDEIGFVQFHPSYDYTDFVEGLRPVRDENGEVVFERMDGVFKKFCRKTIISKFSKSKKYTNLLGNNPTVWKISLEGTGENKTRAECMENNHIRIGWSEYGDIDISTFNNYSDEYGGSNVLQTFANKMKIGDIVLSCYSEWTIDAIGIVTSDYYFDDLGGDYPRYRDVEWIMKGLKYDIHDLNNNKRLTLASVYKLNISYIDVLNIIEKENTTKDNDNIKNFVFIIDEINRGELSKIFGELFYCIDPGYRGITGKINTQYQNMIKKDDPFYEGFYIPENVYIIGTMNDIDRSVESMDFAFRRRFTFKEITAKDTQEAILSEFEDSIREEAVKRMDSLNNAIDGIDGLSSAYHIGGAYFLKLKDLENSFENLWEYHLSGLLREYLRGMEDADESLEKLHKAYNLENQEK